MKKVILFSASLFVTILLHAAVYKTVSISAGGLSTALTATEKTTVTNLTVTGSIDARDVKVMRDSIPNLSALDISAVSIKLYTGTAGTESVSTTFPANELPRSSFCNNDYAGRILLKSIVLPSSITSIGFAALQGCTGLTSINIPASVTSIGNFAFYGCTGISSMTIPGSVTSLGNNAFSNCTALSSISIPTTITSIKDWTFSGCTKLTNITIPATVTSIGAYAFYGCSGLTSLTIPNAVTSIGESAFYGCSKLTSVTIPNAVTSLANSTFGNCTGLTGITLPNTVTTIGDWTFLNCTSLNTINLPNSVVAIGSSAFYNCIGLATITIPASVTSIGESAFYNCKALTAFTFPGLITKIENSTFNNCTGLTTITIPNTVSSVGSYAFYGCTGLTSLSMSESIASIGEYAFTDCNSLNSIYAYDPTPIAITANVFTSVNKSTCTLYIPVNTKSVYQATTSWNEFTKTTEMVKDHFVVAFTGNGQNHMNLNILAASLNGINLEAGDEIAAFDNTICCGKASLTQPINISDINTIVTISASKKDNDLANGFNVGNAITYKYWDASKNEEISFVTAEYFDANTGLATTTPMYTANASGFVKLSGKDPIANAGTDQTVNEGAVVTLDGSASSDANNNTLTYLWTAPAGITLSSKTVSKPTFTAPEVKADTIFALSLVVNEGTVNSTADQVLITVKQVNKVPVANAGTDQSVNERLIITLDGTDSSDLDGNTLTYQWTAPAGITLSSATASKPTFKAPEVNADTPLTFSLVVNDGTVSSLADQVIITVKQKTYTQKIPLISGWNMVSFNVVSSKTNLKDILQPLIDGGKLKMVMDESGKAIQSFGAFGGWKNAIGNFSQTEGYKIKMTGSDTISIEGDPTPLPLEISLKAGWNVISYPCANAQNALTLIQPLIDAGILNKVIDETGKTIEDFGEYGGWVNNIGNFVAGKGYAVNVTSAGILSMNSSELRSATFVSETEESTYFTNVYEGNGVDHMNINLVNLNASILQANDEIGIFDGNLCVGSAKISVEQMEAGRISITTSCNDGLETKINGFTPGNAIAIKLYSNGFVYDLDLEKISGSETFEKNSSLFAKVMSKQTSGIVSSKETVEFSCYPNPFTEELTVHIQNSTSENLSIDIYNLLGQKINSLYKGINSGDVSVKWDGTDGQGHQVVPGTYLCKVNNQSSKVLYSGKK